MCILRRSRVWGGGWWEGVWNWARRIPQYWSMMGIWWWWTRVIWRVIIMSQVIELLWGVVCCESVFFDECISRWLFFSMIDVLLDDCLFQWLTVLLDDWLLFSMTKQQLINLLNKYTTSQLQTTPPNTTTPSAPSSRLHNPPFGMANPTRANTIQVSLVNYAWRELNNPTHALERGRGIGTWDSAPWKRLGYTAERPILQWNAAR